MRDGLERGDVKALDYAGLALIAFLLAMHILAITTESDLRDAYVIRDGLARLGAVR